MKKFFILFTILSIGFGSCKKDGAFSTAETENLALESAAVIVAGDLSFSSKTNTGLAKIYRQQSGKYILGLEKMNFNAGTSLVIYLSGSKALSAPYIKVFSTNNLYGNVFRILPSNIDVALFRYLIILAEPSEAMVASGELS